MNETEGIKRRIKKLLALSKSPNENEAAMAMKMANSLMSQYRLNESEFNGYTEKTVKATKRFVEWRAILSNAVEKLYATYHYRDVDTGSFIFCGEELDVFMSTEMYKYLVKTVDRMAAQNIRKNAKHKYRQSYRSGVASRLYERITEMGEQCSWRNPQELEASKKEISEWVHNQVSISKDNVKDKLIKINRDAWNKGKREADCINLNRQMTGCGNRMIGDYR